MSPAQEVWDHILGQLQDDHPALRACAVVCRAWKDHSQYYIFHDLTVHIFHGSRLMRLIDILKANERLRSHVRVIRIVCPRPAHPFGSPSEGDAIIADTVRLLLSLCPLVDSVSWVALRWNLQEQESLLVSLPCVARTRTVAFEQCRFSTPSYLLAQLGHFTALRTLSLFDLSWSSQGPVIGDAGVSETGDAGPLTLLAPGNLRMRGTHIRNLFTYFVPHCLTSLDIKLEPHMTWTLGEALQHQGMSLRSLSLSAIDRFPEGAHASLGADLHR
jgi:hypothetical protein